MRTFCCGGGGDGVRGDTEKSNAQAGSHAIYRESKCAGEAGGVRCDGVHGDVDVDYEYNAQAAM